MTDKKIDVVAYNVGEFVTELEKYFKQGYRMDMSNIGYPQSHLGFYGCKLIAPEGAESEGVPQENAPSESQDTPQEPEKPSEPVSDSTPDEGSDQTEDTSEASTRTQKTTRKTRKTRK